MTINSVQGSSTVVCSVSYATGWAHPKEDVFGRIKACSVDASGVRGAALTHHSAGKP